MFNQHFGNYLLKKKILKPEELIEVLEEQRLTKVKLGVLAIDSGYMDAAQVNHVHKLQMSRNLRFGELAIEEGFLTEKQVDELLHMQKKSNVLLGQVLIEKEIFTFEKYEEVLIQYKEDSGLTADEMEALKENDIKKVTEIFLKTLSGEYSEMFREYFELFIRNVIRFIDNGIQVEEAKNIDSYQFPYLVSQRIGGEHGFFSGFSASEEVMSKFASRYAEEELGGMNDLGKDALGEFMNCQNGLFLSHLSHEGLDLDLFPPKVKQDGMLKPFEKLYVIPCHLSFGKFDFIFSKEVPYFQ